MRLDIPEAPKDEGEEDEEEKNDVDESTFEARLKKLKKKKSEEEEPTERPTMERFDRFKGLDPKKAQAQRESEAIQRRRWLAGLGGTSQEIDRGRATCKIVGTHA